MYSLSAFSLANSLQLIFEISTTFRLVSCLLADSADWSRLPGHYMISKSNVKLCCMRCCVCPYFLQNNVIIKQLLDSVFVNIQNNQGHGVPLAPLITVTSTLNISDVTKTSSDNCLLYEWLLERTRSSEWLLDSWVEGYSCSLGTWRFVPATNILNNKCG